MYLHTYCGLAAKELREGKEKWRYSNLKNSV
jgi:hypothetical protein